MYYIPKIIDKIKPSIRKNCICNQTAKVCGESNLLSVTIGKYSYIGSKTTIIQTEIGAFTSIAGNCLIGGGEHPISHVSTSPIFHEGKNIFKKNFANHSFSCYQKTKIGNDVWIGHGAMIKGGVTIGDGAIIGMGAIVTKDVGEYEIWGGNPAHCIRKRFSDTQIEKLKKVEWWKMNDKELRDISRWFNDIDEFLNRVCYK